MPGSASPEPFAGPSGGRGVVLGGGGLTGIAWLGGVLAELPPVLATANRVVGTSAGAVVAARLSGGADSAMPDDLVAQLAGVRLRPSAAASLLAAQVWPSRRHALQWLGRRAVPPSGRRGVLARPQTPVLAEEALVDLVGRAIGSTAWPPGLIVVAVDALAGRPAYFTARSGVAPARAVAASCAMPGVLPPVRIEGRRFLDGGLRSPANADLATGCERVLVLAPQWRSARVVRRPEHQADKLRADGAEVLLLQSPLAERHSLSAAALPAARETGRRQGAAIAAAVDRFWGG